MSFGGVSIANDDMQQAPHLQAPRQRERSRCRWSWEWLLRPTAARQPPPDAPVRWAHAPGRRDDMSLGSCHTGIHWATPKRVGPPGVTTGAADG